MTYGVAHLSIIPLRSEPSEKSEMVSQLLFGDAYIVLEEQNGRFKIQTCDCQYEGWMDKKLFNPIHELDVEAYLSADKYFVKDYLLFIKTFEQDILFPVFAGSSFPFPKDNILILGNSIFMVHLPEEKQVQTVPELTESQVTIIQFAAQYLNAPYLWGGRSPAGIDCSGFSQIVYKRIGLALPRDASQQVQIGKTIDFVDETQIGDLAFFQNEEGKIIHVGIICGKNKIIHASGCVRIDTIDTTGIFNHETKTYSHFLRIIKRILPL